MVPVVVIMDAWWGRPLEVDFDEFSSVVDASWAMTFIDPNDHQYSYDNFDEVQHIGIGHCKQSDFLGY